MTFWFIISYNPVDGASDSEEHPSSSFVVDMDQGVKLEVAEGFVHIHYPSFNYVPHFEHEHGDFPTRLNAVKTGRHYEPSMPLGFTSYVKIQLASFKLELCLRKSGVCIGMYK